MLKGSKQQMDARFKSFLQPFDESRDEGFVQINASVPNEKGRLKWVGTDDKTKQTEF
jgi:hypothetical protein